MGEIANSMVNGEICAECGVYLDPNERVWAQDEKNQKRLRMPKDGSPMGFPVVCTGCR